MNKAITFRNTIIRPVVAKLGGGAAAEELLLGTAVQESLNLKFRKQVGGGPAVGYFQMEPTTHNDIWDNFLKYRKSLAKDVASYLTALNANKLTELEVNDKYAAAMARVHYMRVPAPLPKAGDITSQANYWKQYYNTNLGKGKPIEYVHKWNLYVVGTSP